MSGTGDYEAPELKTNVRPSRKDINSKNLTLK
jgi:hypothetical protein